MNLESTDHHASQLLSRSGSDGLHGREERHRSAVDNTLSWAQDAADREHFVKALAWLDLVELVDGRLTGEWVQRKASWRLLAASGRTRSDP
jgi:hypothetical protein